MPLPTVSSANVEHYGVPAGTPTPQSKATSSAHTRQDAPPSNETTNQPSNSEITLRTLRLLDLDRLPDWPKVTSETFKASIHALTGQKERVRAAEWVLYRLFELWDSKETKVKLRPFFPPLEPLQSIKLRAALLQWLTALKATGMIGRECMIRKSTLDDCKSDKFEEVLLHFSTAVLRKVVTDRNNTKRQWPIAQSLACVGTTRRLTQIEAIPLQYAHIASTRKCLDERAARKEKLGSLEHDLKEKANALASEKARTQSAALDRESRATNIKLESDTLKKQIRDDSHGDSAWLSVAISGDREHDRDAMIEDTFDKLWRNALGKGEQSPYDPIPPGLLANLEQRLKDQQDRLSQWRAFQNELSRRNEEFIVAQSPLKTPFKSPQKSALGSRQNTPRRTASTRKPQKGTQASLRLQALQASPTKANRPGAQHVKVSDARETSPSKPRPLDSPPEVFKSPPLSKDGNMNETSESLEREETFCNDMAKLNLASPGKRSPTPSVLQKPKSRLPSPTKSPLRQPQHTEQARCGGQADIASIQKATGTTVTDSSKHFDEPCYLKDTTTPPDAQAASPIMVTTIRQGADPLPESSLPATPPLASLSERTQQTMAQWQQKQGMPSQTNKAVKPKLHRYTKSIPQHHAATTPRGSPEQLPIWQQEQASTPERHDPAARNGRYLPQHEATELGLQEEVGSPSPIKDPSTQPVIPASAAASASALSNTPPTPVLPPLTPPQDAAAFDETSAFKPRNRLRRTPPGSPPPWA